MNIKNTIKKIGALATGGALLGATMTGALANLEDYPQPFIQDGQFDGQVVVGSMGTGSGIATDMVGAMNVVAQLQADSVTPVSVGSGSGSQLEGGETLDEEPMNEPITTDTLLDDRDLAGFQDTSVRFDGNDIDVAEEFEHNNMSVTTSLPNANRSVDDFGMDPYLTVESEDLTYRLVFEDNVSESNLGTNSNEDELEVPFMGTELEITAVPGDNELSVTTSNEQFLEEGDTVQVDGRTVELLRVGEQSVRVSVDGETQVISETGEERFDDAGDFEVAVNGVFYIEGADDNGANLELGSELSNTVEDGDSAELFGEPSDESEAAFVWDIDLGDDADIEPGDSVGIRLNQDALEIDDINEDRERAALAVGESLEFPNNYVDVNFEGPEVSSYEDVTVEAFEDETVYPEDGDNVDLDFGYVVQTEEDVITASQGNVEEEGSQLYVGVADSGQHQVWVDNGEDDVLVTNTSATTGNWDSTDVELDLGDTVDVLLPDNNGDLGNVVANSSTPVSEHLRFSFTAQEGTDDETLGLVTESGNDYFGPSDEEEAEDLYYDGTGGSDLLGNQDFDIMTTYGVTFSETESQFSSGSTFEFSVPDEEQTAAVSVTTRDTTTTSGSSGDEAYNVNPLPIGQFAVTDQQAASPGDTPMISVGGPRANSVSAELLDNPSQSEIDEMFNEGEGKIMYFEDEQAVMVGGYSAEDTTGATQVLANHEDFDLSGNDVTVMTSDLSDLSVVSAE